MPSYFLTVRFPLGILWKEDLSSDTVSLDDYPPGTYEKQPHVFYETDSEFVAGELVKLFRHVEPPSRPGHEPLAKSPPVFEVVSAAGMDLAQRVLYRQNIEPLESMALCDGDPGIRKDAGLPNDRRTVLLWEYYEKAQQWEPLVRDELDVAHGKAKGFYLWWTWWDSCPPEPTANLKKRTYFYRVDTEEVAARLRGTIEREFGDEIRFGYTASEALDIDEIVSANNSIEKYRRGEYTGEDANLFKDARYWEYHSPAAPLLKPQPQKAADGDATQGQGGPTAAKAKDAYLWFTYGKMMPLEAGADINERFFFHKVDSEDLAVRLIEMFQKSQGERLWFGYAMVDALGVNESILADASVARYRKGEVVGIDKDFSVMAMEWERQLREKLGVGKTAGKTTESAATVKHDGTLEELSEWKRIPGWLQEEEELVSLYRRATPRELLTACEAMITEIFSFGFEPENTREAAEKKVGTAGRDWSHTYGRLSKLLLMAASAHDIDFAPFEQHFGHLWLFCRRVESLEEFKKAAQNLEPQAQSCIEKLKRALMVEIAQAEARATPPDDGPQAKQPAEAAGVVNTAMASPDVTTADRSVRSCVFSVRRCTEASPELRHLLYAIKQHRFIFLWYAYGKRWNPRGHGQWQTLNRSEVYDPDALKQPRGEQPLPAEVLFRHSEGIERFVNKAYELFGTGAGNATQDIDGWYEGGEYEYWPQWLIGIDGVAPLEASADELCRLAIAVLGQHTPDWTCIGIVEKCRGVARPGIPRWSPNPVSWRYLEELDSAIVSLNHAIWEEETKSGMGKLGAAQEAEGVVNKATASSDPQTADVPRESGVAGGLRGTSAEPVLSIDALLEDANYCLMVLGDMRRDYGILAAVERRMEGGGEDWHFADDRDKSDYREAKRQIDSNMRVLPERLTRVFNWGLQHGIDVAENLDLLTTAKASRAVKADICGAYELDVRAVINAVLVEQTKEQVGEAGGGTGLKTSQVRSDENLPTRPADLGQTKRQPWSKDAPEYLPLKEAVKLTDGYLSLQALSKKMKPTGEMRYMQNGQRCKVHIADFFRYIKSQVRDPEYHKLLVAFMAHEGKGDLRFAWKCSNCGAVVSRTGDRCPKRDCPGHEPSSFAFNIERVPPPSPRR